MKIFSIVILCFLFLIIGYLLGTWKPLSTFMTGSNSIKGTTEVKVTVLGPTNQPVTNLEVDIATKNGPPTAEGVRTTDAQGVATFNLKAGHYFVFFNTTKFPSDFNVPRESEIDVIEGQINAKTIILSTK